jgi:hypothetical protein
VYRAAGLTNEPLEQLRGRELGLAVAEAMMTLARRIDFPTRLADVPGFEKGHIRRALAAAKSPQLKMKLQNMPVPMDSAMVDTHMAAVLDAACAGDAKRIRNVSA